MICTYAKRPTIALNIHAYLYEQAWLGNRQNYPLYYLWRSFASLSVQTSFPRRGGGIVASRSVSSFHEVRLASRVVKRSAAKPLTMGSRRGGRKLSPLSSFIVLQLSRPVEKAPVTAQWLHEINSDGFRMAAPSSLDARNSSRRRVSSCRCRKRCCFRQGHWTGKYIKPAEIAKPISIRPGSSLVDLSSLPLCR
jgi:hypothetical protein